MLKQYNTINQLFRIITNLKTINTSNAFYAIKYFKSNNNYTYMNNNAQQFAYVNNNINKVDASLSFKKTPPIVHQHRNSNYRNHIKYNSNNISNERIKRAKSLKSTPIHVNKSFSSSVPLNNYNFNNCSWYNFNQNNNSNNNGFIGVTPVKKRDTISVKSMLNKREKTLMSKLKREHNIKFKQSQNTKVTNHKYSNSALNKSYNSNYHMVNKKMNLLDEINLNDDEQDDNEHEYNNMNKERQLIEIDGDDYNYNEYNNYQHINQNDKQFEQQEIQYYNNNNSYNYNSMNNYYPKSTKASHLFNTEIYSLRMSDNY